MAERRQGNASDDGSASPALEARRAATHDTVRLAVVIGALGVVFGDIGTSPIYTLQTVFNPGDPHPVPVSTDNVYGVVSLVFWSVMIIVTVTYVLLATRADNDGEGGIMALITLLRRWSSQRGRRAAAALAALGIFGASLFFGDSMITPAISVLSAVEGLKVVQPSLEDAVVPITAVIIVLLFLVQRRGTAAVGRVFGPVMIAWFTAIGACGVAGIADHPDILKALSPTYALGFLFGHWGTAFFALAAIVLAVTGAEALYADMGHFGRRAITRGWLFLVLPACVLSYLGQGALILDDPDNISSPFFLLVPGWGRWPMVLLATAATVIASQAVITGAYSVASQAAQLGYLPRLRIAHTSESTIGQIYVPWINWLLMVSVLTLVFAFRASEALAYAFGMAVTGTITITTLLFFYVARAKWGTPRWLLAIGAGVLLFVDLLFVAANLTKLVHGAWLPLLIGLTAFTVMTTWQRGRELVTAERARQEGPLPEFIEHLRAGQEPTVRAPGTAVFLNRGKETAPLAMVANVEHNHVRHDHVVILSIRTEPVPRVQADQRIAVDGLGYADDGIIHVTARFGYMETPDVPGTLALLDPADTEGPLQLDQASYFLSKIELRRGKGPTMAPWRKRLFIATSYITADAAEYFGLPRDRTVIMGSQIEV
ncbi:putative potassium transport system protein kup [Streptomyces violarus]|uniref:Probable potassium transport system protein Kup n=1 Tax=Streptomyces violarus TaxID=67380 RepID=A0A7W4ZJM4_9ACTN|nr:MULTISPECIES: potassium transporter Kup [Streptomyces]MBB3073723.1 KUP system potassium uptake protein [Streptomyces violarus]WRT96475.1 potassium transporter Kup [Streptomyces sp. CGMCC 4.1772]GHC96109.1 putative potassium transport system protein kup [Streptomyces violarus]